MTMKPGGPTPLYDAIYRALELLASRPDSRRKVIVVNSDGGDDTSRHSLAQLEVILGRPGAILYGVGPAGFSDAGGRQTPMIELSRLTGGRYLLDGNSTGSRIAQIVRSQYWLGYSPSGSNNKKSRKLKIELRQSAARLNAKVSHRPSYELP